jgi:serine/threonine-protein kinase
VYSFGILLFELLTGTKPVTGDTVEKIFHRILYEPINFAPIRALKLPPGVERLIARCTSKPPAQRPLTLAAVCDDIDRILNPPAPEPAVETAPPEKPPAPREQMPAILEKLPAQLRTEQGLMVLAGIAVLVLVLFVYLVLSKLPR